MGRTPFKLPSCPPTQFQSPESVIAMTLGPRNLPDGIGGISSQDFASAEAMSLDAISFMER
jgi:hypothetical protein